MFALRSSPDAGEKRKRPVADSEPPRRPPSPLTRLSPPAGHRSVQALAKRQFMPLLHENPRKGAVREKKAFSSRPGTNTSAKSGHSQARRFVPLKSASEPRETRLPDHQPRVGHSDTQPHYSRPSNEQPPIRLSTEDTLVASPVVRRSKNGKTGRGQAHGAVKKSAKGTLYAETLAEPQQEPPASELYLTATQYTAELSSALPLSVHAESSSTSVEDQHEDKAKRPPSKTTWDAALDAHPSLRETFPARPNNDIVAFLAKLPAAEGALDESPKLSIVNGQIVEKGFELSRAQSWKDKRLQAALAQSHGILSKSRCSRCVAGKGVYTTCVRAPTRPGESQDVFDGGAGIPTPLMSSDDPLPEKHRERHQGEAEQSASSVPHSENEISQGDGAQSVPTIGKDAHDSKHRLQDQVVRYAYRLRTLPLEQRQAVTEQIESLLGGDSFEPDVLDIARCVYDLPKEERAQSSKMIIQILRGLLI